MNEPVPAAQASGSPPGSTSRSSQAADAAACAQFEQRLLGALPRLESFVRARYPHAMGDVVQETLLRAWRSRSSFDPSREMWPWLRVVAGHAATRRLEVEERRGASVSFDAASGAADLEARAMAEDAELGIDLQPFLERLRPTDRAVVEEHYFDGSSLAELAAARACPVGTVKSQLSRARKRLAVLIGGAVLLVAAIQVGPWMRATGSAYKGPATAPPRRGHGPAKLRSHAMSIKVERALAPTPSTRDLSKPSRPAWGVKTAPWGSPALGSDSAQASTKQFRQSASLHGAGVSAFPISANALQTP